MHSKLELELVHSKLELVRSKLELELVRSKQELARSKLELELARSRQELEHRSSLELAHHNTCYDPLPNATAIRHHHNDRAGSADRCNDRAESLGHRNEPIQDRTTDRRRHIGDQLGILET